MAVRRRLWRPTGSGRLSRGHQGSPLRMVRMAGAIQPGKGATGNFCSPNSPGPLIGSTQACPPGCELGHPHLPEGNFSGQPPDAPENRRRDASCPSCLVAPCSVCPQVRVQAINIHGWKNKVMVLSRSGRNHRGHLAFPSSCL